jgi:hypothetical protein
LQDQIVTEVKVLSDILNTYLEQKDKFQFIFQTKEGINVFKERVAGNAPKAGYNKKKVLRKAIKTGADEWSLGGNTGAWVLVISCRCPGEIIEKALDMARVYIRKHDFNKLPGRLFHKKGKTTFIHDPRPNDLVKAIMIDYDGSGIPQIKPVYANTDMNN